MDTQTLNRRFAIEPYLTFVDGPGGLVLARIGHPQGEALVSTHGGHLLHYRCGDDGDDLLFTSRCARFETGIAIRGGVPVCWPWFGPDPEGRGRPAHGLARTRQWQVLSGRLLDDGRVGLVLRLQDDDQTRALWPHRFDLQIEFRVGETLEILLTTHNLGDSTFTLTQALHSYFAVGDIGAAGVIGLDGCEYVDKLDDGARRRQDGDIRVEQAVDRVYACAPQDLAIDDALLERRVCITSRGSHSTVVWNPWVEGATAIADLDDGDYRRMLCVETANAGDDRVELAPGESCELAVRYSVEAD